MDDKLKSISDQLYKLAVDLDTAINETRPTELELVEEGAKVPPEPSALNPFPDEEVQTTQVGDSFTVPDGNPNIVDPMSDKADEMGVEGGYTVCAKCLSNDYLKDNRKTIEDTNKTLSQGTSGLSQDDIDLLERKARIPMMTCSNYRDDQGCGWATWDLTNNPPLGNDLWKEKRLEEYNA